MSKKAKLNLRCNQNATSGAALTLHLDSVDVDAVDLEFYVDSTVAIPPLQKISLKAVRVLIFLGKWSWIFRLNSKVKRSWSIPSGK